MVSNRIENWQGDSTAYYTIRVSGFLFTFCNAIGSDECAEIRGLKGL